VIAKPWLEGRGPLGFLPSILFADRRPVLVVLLAFVLTIAGSFVLGALVTQVAGDGVGPDLGKAPPVVLLIGLALVSPLLETLLMGGIIDLLRRWMGAWQAAVASAAIWGVLHSLLASWWGAVIWWPFLIFSTLYVTWRRRSLLAALAVPASVHMMQNTAPVLLLASGVTG
jgi:membrane protease YdiL (CAAX protease family)